MQVRRIGPDGGFLREFTDVRKRVQHLETRPSGVIATRDMFIVTDPVTGVKTIMGTLPDGTTGFQPFVGDIVPPPVATAPIATAQPGMMTITWDGTFVGGAEKPADFVHLNVIAHKIVSGSTVLSLEAGTLRLPYETLIVSTDVLTYGETWQFSFESEDYNGNISARSVRSAPLVQLSVVDDAEIADALNNLQTNIDSVQLSADGKNRIWYSASEPVDPTATTGDTWYDTDDGYKIYNFDGAVWQPVELGSNAIADLAITNAKIADATIQAAKIGSVDAGTISVGEMDAIRIKAKSMTLDRLVMTSTDNLIMEADFDNGGKSWELSPNIAIYPISGRGATPALGFTGTTSTLVSNNLVNKISIGAEDRFRGGFWVSSTSVAPSGIISLKARAYSTSAAYTDLVIASNKSFNFNTWTNVSGISPVFPSGTIAVSFFLEVTNSTSGTITYVDYVSVTRATSAELIVDGSVKATSLESDLVLATRIVAGNPLGTHAEMSPQGFRVYAEDAVDGIPNEVVRLGVAETDDYFAVTRSDGTLAATISQDGVGSFSEMNATNALYYKGQELQSILNTRTNVVAAAYRTTNPAYNATQGGGWVPYLRLEVTMVPGRLYKIWTSPIRVDTTGDSGITVALGFNQSTLATTSNATIFTQGYNRGLGRGSITLQEFFAIQGGVPRTVSIIMFFGLQEGTTGEGAIRADLYTPVRLTVEDMGTPQGVANGTWLDSAAAPAPAKNTYVTQWNANNMRSYDGANNWYNYNTSQMYQGLSPAGYGNMKSIATFPDMTSALSGSTINYVRVYFNFNHWYYNSGGTARIGLHAHTAVPATFSQSGTVVTSSGWPKPGARWIDIPSIHWDNIKSGVYRGVSLEGDNTYQTYGLADPPVIEISYTK